jgi:hypothetical protein
MRRYLSICILAGIFALPAVGCNVPTSLNLYTVDAISGRPIASVRIQQTDKHWSTSTLGFTDKEGRLDGVSLKRNDRLLLTHAGYEPLRLLIDFQEAKPLNPVAPAPWNEEAQRADQPLSDADAFPFAPDHMVTILMHPQ